jgi:hypothetical protein
MPAFLPAGISGLAPHAKRDACKRVGALKRRRNSKNLAVCVPRNSERFLIKSIALTYFLFNILIKSSGIFGGIRHE